MKADSVWCESFSAFVPFSTSFPFIAPVLIFGHDNHKPLEDGHEVYEEVQGVLKMVTLSRMSLLDDKLSVIENESTEEKQAKVEKTAEGNEVMRDGGD